MRSAETGRLGTSVCQRVEIDSDVDMGIPMVLMQALRVWMDLQYTINEIW